MPFDHRKTCPHLSKVWDSTGAGTRRSCCLAGRGGSSKDSDEATARTVRPPVSRGGRASREQSSAGRQQRQEPLLLQPTASRDQQRLSESVVDDANHAIGLHARRRSRPRRRSRRQAATGGWRHICRVGVGSGRDAMWRYWSSSSVCIGNLPLPSTDSQVCVGAAGGASYAYACTCENWNCVLLPACLVVWLSLTWFSGVLGANQSETTFDWCAVVFVPLWSRRRHTLVMAGTKSN